jgi:hypothetical protein
MRKFIVDLAIDMADKKINTIKEVRRMLGMGLGDAKRLVEAPRSDDHGGFSYRTGGTLICNGDQVARLVAYTYGAGFGEPQFILLSVKEIEAPSAIDVSDNPVP